MELIKRNTIVGLIKRNLIVGIISLIFQGAWEYWVCGYFYNPDGIPEMNKLMIEATLGDVFFTLFVFNIMAILYKNTNWRINKRNVFGIILMGITAAMYFESRALWIGRWAYSPQMLYLKDTNIGVLPIVQFALLIPLSIKLEEILSVKFGILKKDSK